MKPRLLTLIGLIATLGGVPHPVLADVSLQIATRGNELSYDLSTLTVHAGEKVALTFTNRADRMSGLHHNWVLTPKEQKSQVVSGATQAGASRNYVPDSSAVIAHTRLLGPGESQTIHFRAPSEPGDYSYFCSFPGHSEILKGVLKVTS